MITIALAWLLFIPISNSAQTVQASEVDYYPDEIGDNAIIRTDSDHFGSVIYYEAPNGRSYFLYRLSSGITYKYTWPNHNNTHMSRYQIHDMVIGDGRCYFCGSYIQNPLSNPLIVGLIGWIDLTNIANVPCSTASVSFNTCPIPRTKKFTQMDEYYDKSNYGSQLCLVGESYTTPTSLCAFAVWDAASSRWFYRIVEVPDTNETLTDIAFSGLGTKVVTVSRFANEPYKFGLRGEYTSNLFAFPPLPTPPYFPLLTNFTHRNIVNTYGLYLASSSNPHPTWHENDIVARIVCPPNSEEFTVAYECVDNTKVCETQRQVAMYKIDMSNFPTSYTMTISGQQIVRGYFEEGSTFTDMMYIPDNKTFALLHQSRNSSKGKSSVMQFPSWMNYGQISTLISDSSLHSSMDIRQDNSNTLITLTGNNENGNRICYFWQHLNHLETSCYQTRPVTISEELIGPPIIIQKEKNTTEFHSEMYRSSTNRDATEIPQTELCKSYYIQ